jgi:hypothetical protein
LALKEELTSVPLKLVHKIESEGMLLNSFYETSVTLIPKPDKNKKEKYRTISLMNIHVKLATKYLQT